MSKPLAAHLNARKKALERVRWKVVQTKEAYAAARAAVEAKYEPVLNQLDDYIESEETALKELEERLKA